MTRDQLISEIKKKKSFLCVGLDPDLNKIPQHLLKEKDPIFSFNKAIIDATKEHVVAYKPNLAFYECHGAKGWDSFKKTVDYIGEDIMCIADAKRGDIGNTSSFYAKTFFETYNCNAITVAPYMGEDSVSPFLDFKNKWVALLALNSNKGADDFQFIKNTDSEFLFEQVIKKSKKWGNEGNLMYVVGATRPEYMSLVRKHAPNHFLLVPGVGAQGGSLSEVTENGWSKDCGLLINSSRSILYASNNEDFGSAAKNAAAEMHNQMKKIGTERGFF